IKKIEHQLFVEVESKEEIYSSKLDTQNPDTTMENVSDTLSKGTNHTGENNHQEDTLEEVWGSSDGGITESEVVVDEHQEEKIYDTEMVLHSEAEGTKQMPDITEMLISTGEDIEKQDHAIARSYDIGEKKHLDDNFENILDSALEDIKALEVSVEGSKEAIYDTELVLHSEAEGTKQMPDITEKRTQTRSSDEIKESKVVDRNKEEKNYDTVMVLSSEDGGSKQIPDITKEKAKTRNSDSEKIVVIPGEDIKQQAIGLSNEEKTNLETFSCCENPPILVTEEFGDMEKNPVIAANVKCEEKNDLEKLLNKPLVMGESVAFRRLICELM
ncbi:hypothetical protein XELAEV_18038047mg, partial [Xenopus laevis]